MKKTPSLISSIFCYTIAALQLLTRLTYEWLKYYLKDGKSRTVTTNQATWNVLTQHYQRPADLYKQVTSRYNGVIKTSNGNMEYAHFFPVLTLLEAQGLVSVIYIKNLPGSDPNRPFSKLYAKIREISI